MTNERLRAALKAAGVGVEELARLVDVQPETVYRWVGGRRPYARHRSAVARALGCSEQELWPEPSADMAADEASQEILGAWGSADHSPAGLWSALLDQASDRIDLVSPSLDEILSTPGAVGRLSEKAAAGCRIRVALPAADSRWLTEAAHRSGTGKADYVGRTELHRQVELAIGRLQPLLDHPNVAARATYDDASLAILRFDQDLLLTLILAGANPGQQPGLHLRRAADGGLFERLTAHVDAVHARGVPLERDPELYPDPEQIPQRYQPVTEQIYRGQLAWLERELGIPSQASRAATKRPGKLRRRPPQT